MATTASPLFSDEAYFVTTVNCIWELGIRGLEDVLRIFVPGGYTLVCFAFVLLCFASLYVCLLFGREPLCYFHCGCIW